MIWYRCMYTWLSFIHTCCMCWFNSTYTFYRCKYTWLYMCLSLISPEEYQTLCQQVLPLDPIGPGNRPYVPNGPSIGPHGPYVPYVPQVPVIPVPQPPVHPGPVVVPPLRVIPSMFQLEVGVLNIQLHQDQTFTKSQNPDCKKCQQNLNSNSQFSMSYQRPIISKSKVNTQIS